MITLVNWLACLFWFNIYWSYIDCFHSGCQRISDKSLNQNKPIFTDSHFTRKSEDSTHKQTTKWLHHLTSDTADTRGTRAISADRNASGANCKLMNDNHHCFVSLEFSFHKPLELFAVAKKFLNAVQCSIHLLGIFILFSITCLASSHLIENFISSLSPDTLRITARINNK